jgi:hypothetical protein
MITADDLISHVLCLLKRGNGSVDAKTFLQGTQKELQKGMKIESACGDLHAAISSKGDRRRRLKLQSSDSDFSVDAIELSRVFDRAWQRLSANQVLYSEADRLEMTEGFATWLSSAATVQSSTRNISSVREGALGSVKFGDFADWFVLTYQRMFTQKFFQRYTETNGQQRKNTARGDDEGSLSALRLWSTNAMRWKSDISNSDGGTDNVYKYGIHDYSSSSEGAFDYDEAYTTRLQRNGGTSTCKEEAETFKFENPFSTVQNDDAGDITFPVDANTAVLIDHDSIYAGANQSEIWEQSTDSMLSVSRGNAEIKHNPRDYTPQWKAATKVAVHPQTRSSQQERFITDTIYFLNDHNDVRSGVYQQGQQSSCVHTNQLPVPSWYNEQDEDECAGDDDKGQRGGDEDGDGVTKSAHEL